MAVRGIGIHIPVKQAADGQDLDIGTRTRNALQRSLRCSSTRTTRSFGESDARVETGLDDLAHAQVLRVLGLQMRRDQAYLAFEDLQRNAGLNAGALDVTPRRDGVIAIYGTQQRRLP